MKLLSGRKSIKKLTFVRWKGRRGRGVSLWRGRARVVFQGCSLIKLVYRVNPLDVAALDAASLPPLPNLERKSFADKTS